MTSPINPRIFLGAFPDVGETSTLCGGPPVPGVKLVQ